MTAIGTPEQIGWTHQRGYPELDSSGFWQARVCGLFSVAGILRASGVDVEFAAPERLSDFLKNKYFAMLDGDRLMRHNAMADFLRAEYGASVICRNLLSTEHDLDAMLEKRYVASEAEVETVKQTGHMNFAEYFTWLDDRNYYTLTSMKRGFSYFPPPNFALDRERWLTHGSSHPVMPTKIADDHVTFYDVMEPYHMFGEERYARANFVHSAAGSITPQTHFEKFLKGPSIAISFPEQPTT